jgi:ectoine hydroxylase-related dioxygenase (phytanoyl-CoA dioxygenase family)
VTLVDQEIADYDSLVMSAGDLLIFDSHLIHSSCDNLSTDPRVALCSILLPRAPLTERPRPSVAPLQRLDASVESGELAFQPPARSYSGNRVRAPYRSRSRLLGIKSVVSADSSFVHFRQK